MKAVKERFPDKEKECTQLIQPQYLVYNNSDMRTRLVIPKSLRNRVKMIHHANHRRDLVWVKKRAQEHVFWPKMIKDLKSYIDQCKHCQIHMPSHQKEPLIPTEAPRYPFQ